MWATVIPLLLSSCITFSSSFFQSVGSETSKAEAVVCGNVVWLQPVKGLEHPLVGGDKRTMYKRKKFFKL